MLCGFHEISYRVYEIPYGVHEVPFGADAVLRSPPAAPVLPPCTLFAPLKRADGYFPLLHVSAFAPVYGDGN